MPAGDIPRKKSAAKSVLRMTIERTQQFYAYAGIQVELWRGTRDGGDDVTALVATVTTRDGDVWGLTPMPPPRTDLTDLQCYMMTRIWQLGRYLTNDEARALADAAEAFAAARIPYPKRLQILTLKSALAEVAAELRRQRTVEGWSIEHDDEHRDRSLAAAASAYAWMASLDPLDRREAIGRFGVFQRGVVAVVNSLWPSKWAEHWFKPKDPRRDLVRAAALCIAEIERLDRADAKKQAA